MAESNNTTVAAPTARRAQPILRSAFWIWTVFGFGAFLHLFQFLLVVSPNERPILTGKQPVTTPVDEESARSLAELLVSGGITLPEWFLNGIAVTAGTSVICLIAVVFLRKWGLYGYTLATLVMVGLTIAAGVFSPFWLIYPTFITVIGVMNRDQLK